MHKRKNPHFGGDFFVQKIMLLNSFFSQKNKLNSHIFSFFIKFYVKFLKVKIL